LGAARYICKRAVYWLLGGDEQSIRTEEADRHSKAADEMIAGDNMTTQSLYAANQSVCKLTPPNTQTVYATRKS
jgi:hypothetical protein